jgi:hypothetical protein
MLEQLQPEEAFHVAGIAHDELPPYKPGNEYPESGKYDQAYIPDHLVLVNGWSLQQINDGTQVLWRQRLNIDTEQQKNRTPQIIRPVLFKKLRYYFAFHEDTH